MLEPSCGHGAFLDVIVERLVLSCERNGIDLATTSSAIIGVDLDPIAVEVARTTIVERLTEAGIASALAVELAASWVQCDDFLKVARDPARGRPGL